jgi:hypothetical protein
MASRAQIQKRMRMRSHHQVRIQRPEPETNEQRSAESNPRVLPIGNIPEEWSSDIRKKVDSQLLIVRKVCWSTHRHG